jgi:arylsulfatase A-like enzyme
MKLLLAQRHLLVAPLTVLGLCGCDQGPSSALKMDQIEVKPVEKLILFTVDTLRADQLGVYGNQAYATPNIDRFAAKSIVFDNAYSQASLTVPALSSMLTGLLPIRHGIHSQRGALASKVVTLPTIARARGIKTASFIANICVLQPEARTVFHDGWDVAECGMADDVEQYLWDQDVVNRSIAWLEQQEGAFFLWVHLMDPHAEHRPNPVDWDYAARPVLEKFDQYTEYAKYEEARTFPGPEAMKHLWDLYGAEVRGVDREFGRFLAAVESRDDTDEIAMIFSSDHGEELYETWSRYDHGLSLSEGVLWVPLIMHVPSLPPGRNQALVETLQVTPTALQLFDLTAPYPLDGKSLLDPQPGRGFAISSVGGKSVTMRTPQYRYWFREGREALQREAAQWRADAPWFTHRWTIAQYPAEVRTTASFLDRSDPENKKLATQLNAKLREFRGPLGKVRTGKQVGDTSTQAELKKLGYTGYSDITED